VRKALWRIAPWLIVLALVAFLVNRYPLADIRDHMVRGAFWPLVPLALGSALWSLLCVASADTLIFSSVGTAKFSQILRGKAATSVLMAVHYGLSHGGYAAWLARCTGAKVKQAVGLAGYIMVSDLASLCLLGALAAGVGGDALPPSDRLLIVGLGSAAFLGASVCAVLGPRLLSGLFSRYQITEAWARVPASVYFASAAIRLVNLGGSALLAFAAARAFGLAIPMSTFLAYLPVIYFIGALPINIAGFGAVQLAWVGFFQTSDVPGAQVLAFQFLFQGLMMTGIVLRGVPFLRRVVGELKTGDPGDAPNFTPVPMPPLKPIAPGELSVPAASRSASNQHVDL